MEGRVGGSSAVMLLYRTAPLPHPPLQCGKVSPLHPSTPFILPLWLGPLASPPLPPHLPPPHSELIRYRCIKGTLQYIKYTEYLFIQSVTGGDRVVWRAYTGVIHCVFDHIHNRQNCLTTQNNKLVGEGSSER
jgi:hypothetical protein